MELKQSFINAILPLPWNLQIRQIYSHLICTKFSLWKKKKEKEKEK